MGFDSIYELQLTVLPSYLNTEYLEICEGTVLTHRGRQIYEQGIYYDTLFTQQGCDSIYKIVVNKAATYFYESHAQIEKGGTYDFNGRILTEAGVYYDSLRTISGCDSIFKLTLHENPVYYYEDSVSVCTSELPYEFNDRLLYKGGVYYDSLSTQIGSDSIYRLVLTVLPAYEQYNIVDLCDGDSVWFGGTYLYNPGMYSDTLKTRMGCDSIFHLTVNRAQRYYFRDSIALPVGESYVFHGQTIRTSGTYYDYQKTYQGCDSIYEQVVMFYPTYRFIEKDTICSSDLPYKFHGYSYYESGVYYDHLHPAVGFDSIYELHLTVLPSYLKTEYLKLCEGTVLTHRGRQIYEPGIYYDTLFTATGCDSICKVVVNYEPKYLFTTQDSIADGSTYNFRGKIISKPGIYFDSLQTVHGCDSVYQLILSKKSTKYVYTQETICKCKTPYVFFGQNIYQSGSYYYFRNDTTYQLDLIVNPDYEIVDYLEICEGSVLTFRGKNILEQGIYYDSLLTKQGCDSIYKIIVNRAASYMVDIEKSICRGSYYKFGGELLTEQGVYYDTVRARTTSCDSIIRLVLTVRDPDSIVTYDTICEFETYMFNGRPINKSGVYNVHSYNSGGCDSTQILYLTVLPTKYINDTVYLCKGEVYNFGGRILNSFGDYTDTICGTNQAIITHLHLAEVEPASLQTIQPISVCSDSKNFSINLMYDSYGIKPNHYTITFSTAASRIGFKDIYDQPLEDDHITIDMPYTDGSLYLQPNVYMLHLELKNLLCSSVSNKYDIPFEIRYPSWLLEQNWNDVVAILNQNYNGGYSFIHYEWYVNDRQISDAVNSYLYYPFQTGDEVYAVLTRTDGVKVPTCSIIIENKEQQSDDYPTLIYPTIAKAGQSIRIKSFSPASFTIYSIMGHKVATGDIDESGETNIQICDKGTYLIHVVTEENITTKKVIVQ